MVIGRRCYKLSADEDVRPYILGYTALNDFTARDIQKTDSQWTRGKGFDTFCPVGPLVTDEIDPWAGVDVETRVNGDVRQHGNTRDFIFPLDVVIRYISDVMTLEPGDVIATGTPEGVGPVVAGDVIEITVEGVGTLRNRVVDEQSAEAGTAGAKRDKNVRLDLGVDSAVRRGSQSFNHGGHRGSQGKPTTHRRRSYDARCRLGGSEVGLRS